MSERDADVQGGRDGWFNNPAGNPGPGMDTPRRATAAQMAQRKIVRGRMARRPQNIGGSPGSTFNFAGPANVNNPFTPGNIPILHPVSFSGKEGSIGGGETGFRGSIFNLAAGRDSVPEFAPMPSEPLNGLSSEALNSASAAPKTVGTKGLFSGLLMPPSTQSPLASKQQSNTTAPAFFPGTSTSTKPTTSSQPPPAAGETPIQKEKLTNGVSKPASGGSQTSNIFRDIVGNSKAPAVETQKERLTNGVNAATPISQPNKMPPAFNMFGNTPQPAIQSLDKADKFMGIPPPAPANFTEEQKKQYVTLYRIWSLDLSFQKHITSLTELKPGDVEHAARFYTETHKQIVAAGGLPLEGLEGNKRKLSGDETLDESGSPAKKSKTESEGTPTLPSTPNPPISNIFNNLKGDSQAALTNNSLKEASAATWKPESRATPTFPNTPKPLTSNIFSNFKSGSQAAVTNNSFNEANAKTPKLGFGSTPRLETNQGPPASNISNKPKEDSQAAVTDNSSNGASAAAPHKFGFPTNGPTLKPPTFGTGTPVNFLAQFGQSVAETERKEKAKRKAEDFDSDEDDEAEWERKYAEEQRMKKQKLAEEAKGKTARLVPGKGFVIEEDEQSTGGPPKTPNGISIFTPSTVGGASVFDSKAPPTISMPNIFGHLSNKPTPVAPGRSLFDRISKDENGNNIRELPKNNTSSLLAPSAATSVASSRATSPGLTTDTGGESANDSTAEGAEAETTTNTQQLNLITGGPGEEEEDVVFEVRAKAMMWVAEANDEQTQQGWQNKGIGPFRVLKHRETGKARIVMRLDPRGRLILNAALLEGVKYEHQAPAAVKMAVASEDGKLKTWVIKVKKDEDAVKLASILEENKSN